MPVKWNRVVSYLSDRLDHLLAETPGATIVSPPGASGALIPLALRRLGVPAVVWVADSPRSATANYTDLSSLCEASETIERIFLYPGWESLPRPRVPEDLDIAGSRLATLRDISGGGPTAVVVTSVPALMQLTLTPRFLGSAVIKLEVGDEVDLKRLTAFFEKTGYEFVTEVDTRSQAAVRGGIIDLWPPTEQMPVRLELYGTALHSIRVFNPEDQLSVGRRSAVCAMPGSEWANLPAPSAAKTTLLSHLPPGSLLLWCDSARVEQHARYYEELIDETETTAAIRLADVRACVKRRRLRSLAIEDVAGDSLGFTPVGGVSSLRRDIMEPDVMAEKRRAFLADLHSRAAAGYDALLFFDTQGALERHAKLQSSDFPGSRIALRLGTISEGFINDDLKLAVACENDLYGSRRARGQPERAGPPSPFAPDLRLHESADVEPGDLVVHVHHGIGRYRSMNRIVFDGRMQEVMTIEYADEALLHVPVSHCHLLSRYVGVGSSPPALHRLGTRRWQREKEEAARAVADFASSLLAVQAEREALDGHAFNSDTPWQHEFEASFPYRATPDQEQAVLDTMADMERSKPMDRIICGDAGFGKTEVAMRAAFKAVMEGKQVAILVPTTVLCQQHFHTFGERMSAYPVNIEMLSRFCTRSQRTRTLKNLAAGKVDIVIGTHCLLQPGVRFADLGLVVIDEEQRFGVRHKETFKHMRRLVDVLTLTATPIPRTLYMSLMGVRDLSTVQTPPDRRLPVQTIIAENTHDVVRSAVMRELARKGQVYYLYNRIMTIGRVAKRLARIVPDAKIAVAHGRMPAGELAEVMERFVTRRYDVLLCTTIIESGLDIPNVNTIIIDRADRFGLADLYQLRGRVGRSTKKAYAYLLTPERGAIDPVARKRIRMIRKYTAHGSGFKLALRDLELRGAGSMLGTEQSGHATAIGFVLYCQLLRRAVDGLKGRRQAPIVDVRLKLDFISLSPDEADDANAAVIGPGYISAEHLRVSVYRRIAEIASEPEARTLRAELADRYGPVPPSVERLLALSELRAAAAAVSVSQIETRGDRILLTRGGDYVTAGARMPRMTAATPDARIREIRDVLDALS